MVINPEKFQLIFFGCGNDEIQIEISNKIIVSSLSVKLLGVTIDNKLTFSPHIKGICKQANNRINALLRIRKYIDIKKALLLCNAFILSCFKYCPLLWMFCSKTDNNMVHKTLVRAFRAVAYDFDISSDKL